MTFGEVIFPNGFLNKVAKKQAMQIHRKEQEVNRNNLVYKAGAKEMIRYLIFNNLKWCYLLGDYHEWYNYTE